MNPKKLSLVISLVLIIILIGAAVVNIGPDNSNSPNETTEPNNPLQNNPDDTETISILPTGLTEQNGNLIVNEKALLTSHRLQLTNESVTVEVDSPTQAGTRTIKRTNESTLITPSKIGLESVKYSEGDYTLVNTGINTSTRDTEVKSSAEVGGIDSTEYTLLNRFDTLMTNMEVSDYELMEDSVRVEFRTNNSSDIGLSYNLNSIDSARMTAVIHQDGYIENASIRVEGDGLAGVRTVRTQEYSVENIGNTNVEEPSWVGQAEASNPLIKGTLSRSSNYIALEHQGLSTLTTDDTQIEILELPSFNEDTINLNRQFSEGDIIYLRTTTDGWDISYNQEPAEGSRDINNSVSVTATDTEEQSSKFSITFEQ